MKEYCLTPFDRILLEHLKERYPYYVPFLSHIENLLNKEQEEIQRKKIKQGVLLTKG